MTAVLGGASVLSRLCLLDFSKQVESSSAGILHSPQVQDAAILSTAVETQLQETMAHADFVSKVVESKHPYEREVIDQTVTIPGAIHLAIAFGTSLLALAQSKVLHTPPFTRSALLQCQLGRHSEAECWRPRRRRRELEHGMLRA